MQNQMFSPSVCSVLKHIITLYLIILNLQNKDAPTLGFGEMLSWNKPEWYLIAIGCLGSIVNGGSQPAFAVVFSKILSVS